MAQKLADNSSNLTDDTIQKHMRLIDDAKAAAAEAAGVVSRAVKAAKTAGVNVKVMNLTIAARKHDVDKVRGNLRDYLRYLALANMPVIQLDLFGAGPAEPAAPIVTEGEHAEWDAATAGRDAGRAGADRAANPHDAGTAVYVAWDGAWATGQGDIAQEMTEAPARNGRARKRRDDGAPGLHS